MAHLSIKRLDKMAVHKWRDLQEIKNQLLGPEIEAVELYPAESRRIDVANQFHLFALPPGEMFNFGFTGERAVDDRPIGGAVNKPLEQPPAEPKPSPAVDGDPD